MNRPGRGFKTIDEYVGAFPDDVQIILQRMRRTIREAAPGAEEAISYQIPAFKLDGNLVHFAAFKNHIGFYPTSSGIAAFEKELSPYKHATGSVQFPLDKPIPYGLVRKIVVFRREGNAGKEEMGRGGRTDCVGAPFRTSAPCTHSPCEG